MIVESITQVADPNANIARIYADKLKKIINSINASKKNVLSTVFYVMTLVQMEITHTMIKLKLYNLFVQRPKN